MSCILCVWGAARGALSGVREVLAARPLVSSSQTPGLAPSLSEFLGLPCIEDLLLSLPLFPPVPTSGVQGWPMRRGEFIKGALTLCPSLSQRWTVAITPALTTPLAPDQP